MVINIGKSRFGGVLKRALITGLLGQDGRYLASFLASKDYEVYGFARELRPHVVIELRREIPNLVVYEVDICDSKRILELIQQIKPDEIYNLAGFSSVHKSWGQPQEVRKVNETAFIDLIDVIKKYSIQNPAFETKVYQASSSEMFGLSETSPQDEGTEFNPISPYGKSKLAAHLAAQESIARDGLFIATGILYNHESPFRSTDFVTRKISQAAARVSKGLQAELRLGNISATRDWGFAGDYVIAMWKMLQNTNPDTFVIATGKSSSVRDLLDLAFDKVGVNNWEDYVVMDPSEERPVDPIQLVGNPAKALKILNWKASTTLSEIMDIMIKADMESIS